MPGGTSTGPASRAGRERWVVPAALLVQAVLLLPRLGHLPVWSDEQSTLDLVRAPLTQMLAMLRADFHPPLYFLVLKGWAALVPWPATLIERSRLASVLILLGTTVVFDRLWLSDQPSRVRRWCLALWAVSPGLLLYARMARSYTLQVLLVLVAVRLAATWFQQPTSRNAVRVAAMLALLLYVHYLPGLALIGALGLLIVFRWWIGAALPLRSVLLVGGLAGLAYLPWITALAVAASRRLESGIGTLVPGVALEQAMRAAFTMVSLVVGETQAPGVLPAAILVVPLAWYVAARGAAALGWPTWIAALMLVAAWPLASRHVVLAMTPSRVLFALPFLLLALVVGALPRRAAREGLLPAIALLSLLGCWQYMRGEHFLTKAYLVPVSTIAELVARVRPAPPLVLVDTAHLDATALLAALPDAVVREVEDGRSAAEALEAAGRAGRPFVFVRNTHDRSSDRWSVRLRDALIHAHPIAATHRFVAYDASDRVMMRLLGWQERPSHLVEVLTFGPVVEGRRAGPSSSEAR